MRQRVLWIVGLSLAVIFGSAGDALSVSSRAWAQDEGADAAAAPADAAPAAAPAPAPANDKAAEAPAPKKNALRWFYDSLGLPYVIVFLAMSFVLVALFIMNLLSARRENVCPPTLVEAFEAHLNERKYQEAYELAKADESFLGQMLAAGMAKISAGYDKSMQAMTLVGEEENMKLEHRLGYMALIGTIAPMVGLVRHGRRDDSSVHRHRQYEYDSQAGRAGRRDLDGPRDDDRRTRAGHSRHGGFQHHEEPRGSPDLRSRCHQRRSDESL